MNFIKNKQGFGLMEVVIAAVVLGFMLIGLNTLQKGNREGILRVRARDAASSIAQNTIDSLAALGSAMVKVSDIPDTLSSTRFFEGGAGLVKIDYEVVVDVKKVKASNSTADLKVGNSTAYTDFLQSNPNTDPGFTLEDKLAKNVELTVSWDFKGSKQSINLSTVIK
ncbi:MAG: prepilin-type N-terminal cleavage/methylation domain-containing protein [Candidatus Fibromonas sp.]|jgi:Tfp pilus assembly protein PilV|nr:prepilin-type N-terminal cleavage/methylation domain-containing protein [Candidatus Fibromonas sp.]